MFSASAGGVPAELRCGAVRCVTESDDGNHALDGVPSRQLFMATLKLRSNRPLYSHTVIGTLAVDG